MVGHHDVVQVFALEAAAPPGGNEWVNLTPRVDCDQGHRACRQHAHACIALLSCPEDKVEIEHNA